MEHTKTQSFYCCFKCRTDELQAIIHYHHLVHDERREREKWGGRGGEVGVERDGKVRGERVGGEMGKWREREGEEGRKWGGERERQWMDA